MVKSFMKHQMQIERRSFLSSVQTKATLAMLKNTDRSYSVVFAEITLTQIVLLILYTAAFRDSEQGSIQLFRLCTGDATGQALGRRGHLDKPKWNVLNQLQQLTY